MMQRTIPREVLTRLDNHPDNSALSSKQDGRYCTVDSRTVAGEIRKYGQALIALGVTPGDRVAIMAPNGPEWVYADLGAMAAGAITVPIYHTEGLDTLLYIVRDSGSRVLFMRSYLMAVELTARLDEVPLLEKIVLFSGGVEHERVTCLEKFLLGTLHSDERVLEQRLAALQSGDVASLSYTSGTTGRLKGVILTHANILSNIDGARSVFDIGPEDVCLSFLPLSHTFERVDGYYFMLLQGALIAYAESADTVLQNLAEVRPTVVISIPRLYEKMYARVMDRVLDGPMHKKKLFFAALHVGSRYSLAVRSGRSSKSLLHWGALMTRRLAFTRIGEKLGGRLRYFVCGGAPLVHNVAEFFHAVGIPIYEGYGLTETGGGVTANCKDRVRLGTVGTAFPGLDIKVADDGEIMLRGPGVFKGYWGEASETENPFVDGWFKTGDIGKIDADGFLTLTDRKKDMIVTAGGENVAPQFLESLFRSDKFLANALVHGDGKPYMVALLVPNFENLEKYARMKEIDYLNEGGLVGHPQILKLIRQRLDKLQSGLPSFSKIKRFTLLPRDFSSDAGELTPTMKVKRRAIMQRYSQLLEGMYLAKGVETHESGFCVMADPDKPVAAEDD